MNEQIINKISELMQVSYDKAVELYPILREQFVWYELFGNISVTLGLIFIIFLIPTSITFLDCSDYYGKFIFKSKLKYVLYFNGVLLFCTLLCVVLKIILAPDIVFIKGILGGK